MITVEIMKHAAKYMIPWPKIQTILPKFPSQMARSPCPLGMKSSWVKLFTRKLAPRHLGGKFIMKSRKNLKSLSSQNFPELFGTFEKPLLDCFAEERLSTTSTGDTLNTATDSKKALLFGLCCQCRRCTICEWNKWNKWNKWNIFRVVEHCIVQKHEISCHASSHETLPAVAMGKAPHRRKAARPAQPVPPASSSQFGRSKHHCVLVSWNTRKQCFVSQFTELSFLFGCFFGVKIFKSWNRTNFEICGSTCTSLDYDHITVNYMAKVHSCSKSPVLQSVYKLHILICTSSSNIIQESLTICELYIIHMFSARIEFIKYDQIFKTKLERMCRFCLQCFPAQAQADSR